MDEARTADTCPRCGAAFHCGARDATPCPCAGVTLDAATLRALRERHAGCLCLACLLELQAAAATAHPSVEA